MIETTFKDIKTNIVTGQNAVFFDCWNTLIGFDDHDKYWNIRPLMKHSIDKDINWNEVFNFTDDFISSYYSTHPLYEISIESVYKLIITRFNIHLNIDYQVATHEILNYLTPKRILNIDDLIKILNEKKIYHSVLSNSIYHSCDTKKLIDSFIPNNNFDFVAVSKDYGVKKPNKDFFTTLVKRANINIKNAIYVGDAFFQDVYGSLNSGFFKVIWLNPLCKPVPKEFLDFYKLHKSQIVEIRNYFEVIPSFKSGEIWK